MISFLRLVARCLEWVNSVINDYSNRSVFFFQGSPTSRLRSGVVESGADGPRLSQQRVVLTVSPQLRLERHAWSMV